MDNDDIVAMAGLPDDAPAARRRVLARAWDDRVVCLRLPEGDAVELDARAAAALRSDAADPGAAEAVRRDLGAHLPWVEESLSVPPSEPAFVAPAWEPPVAFAPPAFASLPDREHWLLLVAATARLPQAQQAWAEWERVRTPASRDLARRLRPLVAANWRAQDPAAAPPRHGRRARDNWIGNLQALHRLAPLCRRFADAGVRVALLKGMAAVLADYRDPALRAMNDVDLLVPLADRSRAIAILEAAGFRSHDAPDPRIAHRSHAWAYIQPGCLNIDLHGYALWSNCWPGADDGLWAAARSLPVGGAPVYLPSSEMRLLTLCVHAFRHQLVPSHYWAADAAVLLARHGRHFDWQALLAEARARRATRVVREACRYLAGQLGAPIPAAVLARHEAASTAWAEDTIFESFQLPFPAGGPARAAMVSWLNQYRIAARGFSPDELIDFLSCLAVQHGHDSLRAFLAGLPRRVARKIRLELVSRRSMPQ